MGLVCQACRQEFSTETALIHHMTVCQPWVEPLPILTGGPNRQVPSIDPRWHTVPPQPSSTPMRNPLVALALPAIPQHARRAPPAVRSSRGLTRPTQASASSAHCPLTSPLSPTLPRQHPVPTVARNNLNEVTPSRNHSNQIQGTPNNPVQPSQAAPVSSPSPEPGRRYQSRITNEQLLEILGIVTSVAQQHDRNVCLYIPSSNNRDNPAAATVETPPGQPITTASMSQDLATATTNGGSNQQAPQLVPSRMQTIEPDVVINNEPDFYVVTRNLIAPLDRPIPKIVVCESEIAEIAEKNRLDLTLKI